MSYVADYPQPTAAATHVQAQCKQVLKAWQCCCPRGCACFEYRYLLNLCAEGKPLYPRQHEMIERLLQRGTNDSSLNTAGILLKR